MHLNKLWFNVDVDVLRLTNPSFVPITTDGYETSNSKQDDRNRWNQLFSDTGVKADIYRSCACRNFNSFTWNANRINVDGNTTFEYTETNAFHISLCVLPPTLSLYHAISPSMPIINVGLFVISARWAFLRWLTASFSASNVWVCVPWLGWPPSFSFRPVLPSDAIFKCYFLLCSPVCLHCTTNKWLQIKTVFPAFACVRECLSFKFCIWQCCSPW